MLDIKDKIKDFVNFDIEHNYYQEEEKEKLVKNFKEIIHEDDESVRKFLKAFFKSAQNLAKEYSLVINDEEVEEKPNEIDDNETTEKNIETSTESFLIKVASNILYE